MQRVPFLDVFKDASGGNIKTPQKEFLVSGDIPVVDQGQDFIAGFVNDRSRVCHAKPPVIVFGDHTRAIKYIDFEFAMGADGTKVLAPKIESDTKYLYYALKAIEIPAAGYSRHYKFLKETEIPLPPLAEQKRIAKILDAADALRAKRRESIEQRDKLLQSTFLDMFGDPITNPYNFRRETLETAFKFATGKLDSNAAIEGGKYPFFTCARETFAIDDFAFDCEALLLAGNNANADYSVKHHKGKFNAYQRTYVITLDESALTYEYARFALEYMLADLKRFSKGTNTKYLTMSILNRMPILVPKLDLQLKFATIVESIEQQRAILHAQLAELDNLFASLQSRAFRGDL